MKTVSVDQVAQLSTMKALVLDQSTPLYKAIEQFASNEGQHGIFLVDAERRLTGVVNNRELREWARLQFDLVPGELPLPVGKVRRLLGARTIGDLAPSESRSLSVRLSETLEDALQKLTRHELEDIAVIDADGRVVNDLRLSEVLAYALRVGGA